MSFSFRDLTLGGIQAASGGAQLPVGDHIAKVKSATVEKTRTNGSQLVVELVVKGEGSIKDYINIFVPSSEEASRIGRERLKALLVHGGHPDPDNIGQHGVESIRGLTVGIFVREEPYQNDKGETRSGRRVGYYFAPEEDSDVNDPMDNLKGTIPF